MTILVYDFSHTRQKRAVFLTEHTNLYNKYDNYDVWLQPYNNKRAPIFNRAYEHVQKNENFDV